MSDFRFQRIGLIAKRDRSKAAVETLGVIVSHLQSLGCHITLDQHTANMLPVPEGMDELPAANRTALASGCDLIVVIGGDGTLLDAARSVAHCETPLVGVNRGRLGFLVDISPEQVTTALDEILIGKYVEERRLMLDVHIERDGKTIAKMRALNDLVLNKPGKVSLLEFETYGGGRFISHHRADGFIVATPTGSTAYALSGGGPILHPELEALALVPICPHTLTDRPIVIPADKHIELVLGEQTQSAMATADGHDEIELRAGDRVVIRKSEHAAKLLHLEDYDYYRILRSKLHWGGAAR